MVPPSSISSTLASTRGSQRLPLLLLLGLGSLACNRTPSTAPPSAASTQAQPALPADAVVSLYFLTQVHNTTEPCGCTTEPLGDVARLAGLLRAAPGRTLLLDAGGLRYKQEKEDASKLQQARLKADFLEQTWQELGAITMVQPEDLLGPEGSAELQGHPRLATNLSGLPGQLTEVVRTVGGVKLGVLGLVDAEAAWPTGITASDPIAAAQQGVAKLRAQGVQGVIALTGMRRDQARRLSQKVAGLDVVVVGADRALEDGAAEPVQQGSTLLVVPAHEGQRAVRVELHLPRAGAAPRWELARSPAQQQQAAAQLADKVKAAATQLEALRRDPSAEATFVQTSEGELSRLQAALKQAQAPAVLSPLGYVTVELLPISRRLPRDAAMAQKMADLDRRVGVANLQAIKGPQPAPPAGQPSYVGVAGCLGKCHFHEDAIEFWRGTRHAHAWKTLVDAGKDLSYDCVNCHATGFEALGGSNLKTLASDDKPGALELRNVQCEVCHGPGSLHVRSPSKVPVPDPRPTEDRCLICHTKEHSDTFALAPYLRDILGPGHGEERRGKLGAGPTGHELRAAALKARVH